MQIKDFMTSSVVTVRDDTPLKEAARLFVSHGYNVLPVVDDDGSFLGVISEADLTDGQILSDPRTLLGDVPPTSPPAELVAGRLRRGVAGDAAGERKLPEQLHAFRVGWHVGVALRVGVPQCPSSRSPGSSRPATTRPRVDQCQVVRGHLALRPRRAPAQGLGQVVVNRPAGSIGVRPRPTRGSTPRRCAP
jgi:hypothetical protein